MFASRNHQCLTQIFFVYQPVHLSSGYVGETDSHPHG